MMQILNDILKEVSEIAEIVKNNDELAYNGPKIVVYGATRNIYQKMETAAKSLLDNTNVDRIIFLTEDDEYPGNLPEIIKTINVSKHNYFPEYSNLSMIWTYMAALRLTFSKIFPDYDRVLWLDCDTLVVDDISDLFESPLGNRYYVGAVKENYHYEEFRYVQKVERDIIVNSTIMVRPSNYCNTGVLLMNLKKIREDGVDDRMINHLSRHFEGYPDQNVVNIECDGRIYYLSPCYNWSFFTNEEVEPKIIHTSHAPYRKDVEEIINYYENTSFEKILKHRQLEKVVYRDDI